MTDDSWFCPQCGKPAAQSGSSPLAHTRPHPRTNAPLHASADASTASPKKSITPFIVVAIAAAIALVAIVALVGPSNIWNENSGNELVVQELPSEEDDSEGTQEAGEGVQSADETQDAEVEEAPE